MPDPSTPEEGDTPAQPRRRPLRPWFSSGPCAKRPGWSPGALSDALLGRSHRSGPGKARLGEVIERTRTLLGIPSDHLIGIVPASDTGAVEMALWSLLGARPVDVLAWESFGEEWVTDIRRQLRLDDVRVMRADYGEIVDLDAVDPSHDVVFAWNGTTSGVRVPHGDWLAPDREGLAICDATSAVFAQRLPWERLDVVTWSWQKALGGEAQHGMLVLSPRAVDRLESWTPPWPLPKLFRLTKGGKVNRGIFEGSTINTPSMLCVEDCLDALRWGAAIGGLDGMVARADANLAAVARWIETSAWADFLARDPATRSNTSVCLAIKDPWFTGLDASEQGRVAKAVSKRLEAEGVAFDIAGYRDAPPGLRIWCGATVELDDIEALLPWLDWGWAVTKQENSA